jgi:hypothetical protein
MDDLPQYVNSALTDAVLEEILGFDLAEPALSDSPTDPDQVQSWGIVGYRNFTDRERFDRELSAIVASRGLPRRVVSGGATGADTLAAAWAREKGIDFIEHLPKSNTAYNLLARNSLIVRDSTLVIAFLSTKSRGTLDTVKKAHLARKEVITIRID